MGRDLGGCAAIMVALAAVAVLVLLAWGGHLAYLRFVR